MGSNAQKYTVSVQAGGNTSFISKFVNAYTYAQKPLEFDYELDPGMGTDNFIRGVEIKDTKTRNKLGFFADVQMERNLKNNWGIGASLGVNKIAYSYETPDFGITIADPVLNNELSKMGNVKLLYLTTRLVNISKRWNRFSLIAGPELSYLLSKKYVTTVTWQWQSVQNSKQYISSVSDAKGNASQLLIGAVLGAQYDMGKRFYVRVSSQKIFTSLYKNQEPLNNFYKTNVHEKSRPLQAELGLGFRVTGF
ncbi:hypothetical protein GCM10027516_05390 [Niabella aquatica]